MPTTVTWAKRLTWAQAKIRWADSHRTWVSGRGLRWMDAHRQWGQVRTTWNGEYGLDPTLSRTYRIEAEDRTYRIPAAD